MTGDFGGTDGMPSRLRPGSRIAGYVIEERIGAGGMAVVFRARDTALGRTTALKVLTPALASDAAFRARFERESRAIAAMRSPHILPVYTAGESDGVLFIAAQFVPGGDLGGLLRRTGGPLEPGHAATLIVQVAAALDAAHAAGLIHRDVKPGNVLIETLPDGTEHAYLADFGLSKRPDATPLTDSSGFMGTPDYAAPEQVTGMPPASARTDQYALACVAFRMLTGTVPYERDEAIAVLYAHAHAPVPSLAQRRPGLPAALDAVVAKGMAKDPVSRIPVRLMRGVRCRPGSCRGVGLPREAAPEGADDPAPEDTRAEEARTETATIPPLDRARASSGNDAPRPTVTVQRPAAAPGLARPPGQVSRPRLWESPEPTPGHPTTPGIPVAQGSRTGISISAAVLLPILVIGVVTYLVWPKGPAQPGTVTSPGAGSSPSTRATTSGSPRPTIPASLTVPAGPIILPTGTGTDVVTSAFSADGKLLATEALNLTHPTMPDQIVIWNAVTGAYVRTVSLPSGPLTLQGLAFSSDDKRLIAVTVSQGAYQWDVSNGRVSVIVAQVPADDPRAGSTDVAVSADGTAVAVVDASGDGAEVRSTATEAVVAKLTDPDHPPSCRPPPVKA